VPFTIIYDHPTDGEVTYDHITKLEGVWNKFGKLTHYRLFSGRYPTEHRHLGFVKVGRIRNLEVELPEIERKGYQ